MTLRQIHIVQGTAVTVSALLYLFGVFVCLAIVLAQMVGE